MKDFVLSKSQVLFVGDVILLFPSISLLQSLLMEMGADFLLLCFACSLPAISQPHSAQATFHGVILLL